jgi:hypothetical protein
MGSGILNGFGFVKLKGTNYVGSLVLLIFILVCSWSTSVFSELWTSCTCAMPVAYSAILFKVS